MSAPVSDLTADGDPPVRLGIDASNLPRDRRGMGRVTRTILHAALTDPHFDVTLLSARAGDVRALQAEFPQTRVRRAASARRRATYDVVWYPFNGTPFDADAPALVTVHDLFAFTEPHPERIARWREQRPIRRALRSAARICTDSEWSRGELMRVFDVQPARISVVRPVPDAFWFPARDDRLPAGLGQRRYVLLVGAREPRKNASLLVRACARALCAPEEALVVVGDLNPTDRDLALALDVPAGEVVPASDETLRALYRNASAVAVPSLAEGFGLVASEALACGAPVLAADATALPEAAMGAAQLLDPRDAEAWARAIRALFDDAAQAAQLRSRALAAFAGCDRGRGARELLALLRDLAKAGPSSTADQPRATC
ncbi:MAG: glycosyltransferase family 4 protein [Vulcanimicrobiaceae bacterium]